MPSFLQSFAYAKCAADALNAKRARIFEVSPHQSDNSSNVLRQMSDVATQAKARFLDSSARHYVSSYPATSAHLMLQRNLTTAGSAMPVRGKESKGVCQACGTILIPGWSSRTSIVSHGVSKRELPKSGSKSRFRSKISSLPAKRMKVECLICYRFEEIPLQSSRLETAGRPQRSEDYLALSEKPDTGFSSQVQDTKPVTMTTSSKQRARARKQGGLQALLNESKTSTSHSSGSGLDLLDLMKKA